MTAKKNGSKVSPIIGVYEVDFKTLTFIHVSQRVGSELGYTPEELEGQPVTSIMTDESKALFAKRIKAARAGKMIDGTVRYQVITKSGQIRSVEIEAFYKIKKGLIVGALVAVKEVLNA